MHTLSRRTRARLTIRGALAGGSGKSSDRELGVLFVSSAALCSCGVWVLRRVAALARAAGRDNGQPKCSAGA